MKIQEIIREARRNPRQNLGKPDRRELLQYLNQLSPEVRSRTFVHSSTVDKIGINPSEQVFADDARGHVTGVYCWSADYLIKRQGGAAFAEIRPYQFVIELKEHPTVLTEELWDNLWDDVYSRVPDPHDYEDDRDDNSMPPGVKKAGAVSSLILKQSGITSLIDPEGIISNSPGEAIILSLSAIKHYKRFVNHIRPGARMDTFTGGYKDDDVYAHASIDNLLDYAKHHNKLLSAQQEKVLLNSRPLKPHAEFDFQRIKSYIDNSLIPNNQKFKLPEFNQHIIQYLNTRIHSAQEMLKKVHAGTATQTISMFGVDHTSPVPKGDQQHVKRYETIIHELTPYLKYFSQ